jgi:hypothetical protein
MREQRQREMRHQAVRLLERLLDRLMGVAAQQAPPSHHGNAGRLERVAA